MSESKAKATPARHFPSAQELRRLGKNLNGYFGDTIDIDAVLADCLAAARRHGWTIETFCTEPGPTLHALTRVEPAHATSSRRVYLSTGIHGDEPAGPLAIRTLLQANQWPAGLDLWVCPCLNPAGFRLNRRENPLGVDLNRDYQEPKSMETQAHIAWLRGQPAFDLCLCLHEDWESHGFYVYELNPENRPSLAEAMVKSVASVCPIDRSETIEGRPAKDGIIRPSIDPRSRPQWPESFFLLTYKTRQSYTLEAPSDFPLTARVAALATAVETALRLAAVATARA